MLFFLPLKLSNIKDKLVASVRKSSLLWEPQENNIGLSIGHKNVIIVEIDFSADPPVLVNVSVKELTADNPNISDVIKEMYEEKNFSSVFVDTSISGKSIIVRFIKMPKMQRKDMANALLFEAEKYIPFDVSQIYLGFDILNADAINSKMVDVALVAAKKEGVDNIIETANKAGIMLNSIDIDSFACLNTFLFSYPEYSGNIVAIINIGARVTNLLICSKGKPVFSRDIYFGGDDITIGIKKRFAIGEPDALKLKLALENADQDIKSSVKEILSYLLNEISLSFDYYHSQNKDEALVVESIFLTGGTSSLFGIEKLFFEKFNISVNLLNPLKNISVGPDVDIDELTKVRGSLAVAVGSALRGS